MKSIYGISYDFHKKNGHYLMLYENEGKELTGNELIPLHIKMMESNQIPHLLPISIEELDFKVRIYYNVTSKRNLSTYLKNHVLSSFEFYQFFIKIITTLEQSKLYMLNEYQYVLKKDFIYVGNKPEDIYLTYLPLQSIHKESTTLDELKELILTVMEKVEGIQGSEKKHISQYIEDSAFSLSGLKELLLNLQKLRPKPFGGQQPPMNQYNEPGYPTEQADPYQQQANQQSQPEKEKRDEVKKNEKKAPKKKATKKKALLLTQRQKVYIVVLGLLALTIIWKVYEAFPNQAVLIGSACFSLAIVGAVLYLVLHRPKIQDDVEEEVATTKEQEQPMAPAFAHGGYTQTSYNPTNYQQYPLQNQTDSYRPNQAPKPQTDQQAYQFDNQQTPLQSQPSYQEPQIPESHSFSLDTNLLVENDDTVLLEEGDVDVFMDDHKVAYLEVERDGQIETIKLEDSHITIGRNEEAVDYLEETIGVSRVHLEIIKIENQYGVKDLGSRNGTKINGEPLIPYKIYALNEEDVISLGKVEYRFKWE